MHLGYQLALVEGYRVGDLTHVYPIARGTAPLIVAGISVGIFSASLNSMELIGVLLISAGILSLTLVRHSYGHRNRRAAVFALITGCFIAAYSLVDGFGARAAGTALGYWTWAVVGNSVLLGGWTAFRKPHLGPTLLNNRRLIISGLIGGTASYVAYGIVVWAFVQAPIALVTALRETSIIFALLIGVVFLREKIDLLKVAATMATIFGAVIIRISRS